jgi:tripartite-type tricarboxylate transporter receptor subunit TctC
MHRGILAALGLALALSHPASAQTYPSKPIRMVVGFPAGGTTDVMGRLISQKLSERLGQQVVVDNRPGASGMIGADAVAKAAPDGYTLLMSSSTHATYAALYANAPFDAVKDFEPISFIGTTPYVMVVHPSLPVRTLPELLAYAKERPGQLNYAGSTPGTTQHLAWERYKRTVGADMVYVAYRGTGALMPDLLAGRLNAAIDNIAVMKQHIEGGTLRGIAITSATRSPLLPNLPTIAESGVPGFEAIGWFGVYAPARTPQGVVQQLNQHLVAILKEPEFKARLVDLGAEPASGGQEDLRRLLDTEMAVWGKVIKEAGIKVE